VDLAGVDLTDLSLFVDGFPDEVFTRLRHQAPVWWHAPTEHTPDGEGFWVVSTHRHVMAAAADAELFSSQGAPGAEGGGTIIQDLPVGFAAGVLLNMMDDPRHRLIRRVVSPAVAPRALARMEDGLMQRARSIVDAIVDRGECDFLGDVAVELPLQAVASLMGVPDADRHDLMVWSNATLDFEGRELGETNQRAAEAAASMAAYGTDLIADKRRTPGDDIISVVVNAQIEDGEGPPRALTEVELLMFFNLLVVAGSETTRNSIALGMVALVEHPDQLESLRDDRSLMASAVEEILGGPAPPCTTGARPPGPPSSAARSSPRAPRSRCGGRRPIGTNRSSTSRSGSTFDGLRIPTSPSGTGPTSAWGPIWPAWRSG
jgi:cytochrome P450